MSMCYVKDKEKVKIDFLHFIGINAMFSIWEITNV